ncbi:hypothetical protein C8R43DRAFT_963863 [Mycena crocata]|nr:hypothetical protein C8R43DRAFT_963863 [Mycena crocata]
MANTRKKRTGKQRTKNARAEASSSYLEGSSRTRREVAEGDPPPSTPNLSVDPAPPRTAANSNTIEGESLTSSRLPRSEPPRTQIGSVAAGWSDLSSLTPSPSELELLRALRRDESARNVPSGGPRPFNAQRLEFGAPEATSSPNTGELQAAAPIRTASRASRTVAVEEVDDEDDPPHIRKERAKRKEREVHEAAKRAAANRVSVASRSSSTGRNTPSERRRNSSQKDGRELPISLTADINLVPYSALQVPLPTSGTASRASDKSSPYPAASILHEYDVTGQLNDEERAARRKGKQRASTPHTARTNSRATSVPDSKVISDDELPRPANWTDQRTAQVAQEAIQREREVRTNAEEFQRRRREYELAEFRLRNFRVADDQEYAEQLQALDLLAMDDHVLAQQMDAEQTQLNQSTERVLQAQRALADEEARAAALEKATKAQREAVKQRRREVTAQLRAEQSANSQAAETILKSVSAAETDVVSAAHSTGPFVSTAASGIPNAAAGTTSDDRQTHEFRDRVILQRYRLHELQQYGTTQIADQGIDWDASKRPFEISPARSRGSSVGTRGGRVKRERSASKGGFADESTRKRNGSENRDAREQRERSQNTGRKPIDYYTRGSADPPPVTAGAGGGGPSDSNSSSSDGTYRTETDYSRSGTTDSAFGTEIGTGDVTRNSREKSAPHTRRGTQYQGPEEPSDPSSDSESSSGSSDGTSSSSSDPDGPRHGRGNTPRKRESESERARRRRHKRNSRRKHHSHGLRDKKMHLAEPGDPMSAGIPVKNMRKWRRSLHHHYESFIKTTLGKRSPVSSVFDENKNLKFPVPPIYSGSGDVNKFDEHILSMGRWMELMGLGGVENDHKRVITHGFYFAGAAKEWYENQVVGLYRAKKHWTYLDLILGLFDRFIDVSCIQKATDQFWSTKYSPEIGIFGFYHELMTAARRMIKRPDSYTFKTQLMSRMPADMVDALIERNVTAEYCKINEILDCAANYEWHRNLSRRYAAQRRSRTTGAEGHRDRDSRERRDETRETREQTRPAGQSRDNPRMAAGRREFTPRKYKYVPRENVGNEPRTRDFRPDGARVIPKSSSRVTRDGGGKSGKPRPYPQNHASGSKLTCYNCGEEGHYAKDCPKKKKDPQRGPRMYNIEEEPEEEEATSDERKAPPPETDSPPEQLRQIVEDYEGPDDTGAGEQYDSDYTYQECSEYSYDGNAERCAYFAENESDGEASDSSSIPPLMDVSDSESEYDGDTDSDSGVGSSSSQDESESGYDSDYYTADEYSLPSDLRSDDGIAVLTSAEYAIWREIIHEIMESDSEYSEWADENSGQTYTTDATSVTDSDAESDDDSEVERLQHAQISAAWAEYLARHSSVEDDVDSWPPPPRHRWTAPAPVTREHAAFTEYFGVCDDFEDEEYTSTQDIDQLAREMAAELIETGDPESVVERFAAGYERGAAPSVSKSRASQKRGVFLKRSREPRPRPARTKSENFCLTAYVKVNGHAAFALFDSGCTTEACSPDFARVAGIKVFPIQSEITLQLGTAGSRSKINHGMTATVEYDDIKSEEYLDIVNLDQFDLIIGTKFMRKHKMSLDFEFDTIRVCGVPAATLSAKEECSEVERRNAARRIEKARSE